MQILTIDNEAYSLNNLPDVIDDVRYCVLDTTAVSYTHLTLPTNREV